MGTRTLAIVGAGQAGAKAAEAARVAGHDGRIVLIGERNDDAVYKELQRLGKDA